MGRCVHWYEALEVLLLSDLFISDFERFPDVAKQEEADHSLHRKHCIRDEDLPPHEVRAKMQERDGPYDHERERETEQTDENELVRNVMSKHVVLLSIDVRVINTTLESYCQHAHVLRSLSFACSQIIHYVRYTLNTPNVVIHGRTRINPQTSCTPLILHPQALPPAPRTPHPPRHRSRRLLWRPHERI